MKSFFQYILEVATDTPKDIKFEHEKLPLGLKGTDHVHNYHIQHPNGRNYKVSMFTRIVKGKKLSTVNFADTGGRTARTGDQGAGRASRVLSQVHHVIKHHIENENPDGIGFTAEKEKTDPRWKNPDARRSVYRRMAKRSAGKLGYEYDEKRSKESEGLIQHYVRKKKK